MKKKIELDPEKVKISFKTIGKYFYIPMQMAWGNDVITVELCDVDTDEEDNITNLWFNLDEDDALWLGADNQVQVSLLDNDIKTLKEAGILNICTKKR